MHFRRLITFSFAYCLLLFAGACTASEFVTPRDMTATAVAAVPASTEAPLFLPADTPTPLAGEGAATDEGGVVETNPSIVVWIPETSDAHRDALRSIADGFTAKHGVQVEMIQVSPLTLSDLVSTAVLSDTLPDLVLHPMEFTLGWQQSGILDAEAATAVVDGLGRSTFAEAPLVAVDVEKLGGTGRLAAIPSDGWQQLILYRQDWFDERGLPPPTSYSALISGTAEIFDAESGISGLVVPTESSLVSTQQTFEFLATANGCELIDGKGEVQLLHPACLDALDYYRDLINQYSPSDVQTDVSALNAFISGRTGVIIVSSWALRGLADLEPVYRVRCPACTSERFLVENTGIVTELTGRSEFASPASFAEFSYLGITTSANKEAAQQFATYWLSDGYATWLQVNPERKVPLRQGSTENPNQFNELWLTIPLEENGPSLGELYSATDLDAIRDGVQFGERWGFADGQGQVMTQIYEKLTLSIVLQELLSGYFTSSYAIIEAYERVTDLIPGYAFYPEVEPTVTTSP